MPRAVPPMPLLLERERELSAVERALADAAGGDGHAVLVQGDAGIGKTALLAAAAATARAQGFTVLEARADALESALSFGCSTQLFAAAVRDDGSGDGPFAGAAAFARPLFGGEAPLVVPGEDRTLPLVNGLYWLCVNLAERGPLVVSVDDAHWCDVPSLRFLHFLARRLEGLPVCLLVAERLAGAGPEAAAVLDALAAVPGVSVLRPEALSATAAAELVAAALGEGDAEFTEACRSLSGGNPLYLRELLRSAAGAGIAPTRGETGALAALNPEGVSDSVQGRLSSLGAPARALAEVVAVANGRLPLRTAAALAGLDAEQGRDAADALAAVAVLAPGEPPAYAHPLARAAVYDRIPQAARAGLHLRVAERLRDTAAGAEAIAAHLLEAELGGGGWVVDALEAAGTAAMARGSPAAAARYLRRALDEQTSPERRPGLEISLGLAETEAGDPGGAAHLTAAVDRLPAPEARAGVLLALGLALTTQGEVEQASAAYERGIAELAGSDGPVARDLEALCAVGLAHDREARAASLREVEALLATPRLDESASGRLLLAQAAAERGYQGGSQAELRALAERALAPGLHDADPSAFWACVLTAYAWDDCDEYGRAEQAVERALAIARARGSVVQASAACHPRAFINLRRGRIEAALADARESIEGAEQGWGLALPSSRAVLAEAYLARGELAAATEAVELPGGDGPWERLVSYCWLLATRGRVQLASGEAATALTTLESCGELCLQARLANPSVIGWRSDAALAAARLGRDGQARELAETELELALAFGAPRAIGVAQRTLGLLAGDASGIELLDASRATLAASPARLELARTLVELGAALRRAGRRRDARDPLREGLDLAERCGASALAARGLDELQAAGGRPRRTLLTGVESLTPSERRIATLAAEGLSNPQIAQALFVTRRTVEMHLTNAYRKLDIASRSELAAALADGTGD